MTDKILKVYRHSKDRTSEFYDGWYFSRIYGCSDGRILVWDNGRGSSDFDEFVERFEWIDPTETYYDICSKTHHCTCEPTEWSDEK